jgi:hypothetical protein
MTKGEGGSVLTNRSIRSPGRTLAREAKPSISGDRYFVFRIDAGVGQLPVGGAFVLVLRPDAVAVGPGGGGKGRVEDGEGAGGRQAAQHLAAVKVRHGGVSLGTV